MGRILRWAGSHGRRAVAWARARRRPIAVLGASVAAVVCLVLVAALSSPAPESGVAGDAGGGQDALAEPVDTTGAGQAEQPDDAGEQGSDDAGDAGSAAAGDEGTSSENTSDGGAPGGGAPDEGAAQGTGGDVASASSSSETSSGGGSAEGGASSSDGSGASGHTHVWKDHTATHKVWVSNVVTVPDYETRTISGGQLYTLHSDGKWYGDGETYWFYTDEDFEAFKSLIVSKMRDEGYTGNYVNRSKTEQVQTGSHQEDRGHYETETYVDYQFCACGATR